jgi:hypothetical protein
VCRSLFDSLLEEAPADGGLAAVEHTERDLGCRAVMRRAKGASALVYDANDFPWAGLSAVENVGRVDPGVSRGNPCGALGRDAHLMHLETAAQALKMRNALLRGRMGGE